jgi:hypothetical protein
MPATDGDQTGDHGNDRSLTGRAESRVICPDPLARVAEWLTSRADAFELDAKHVETHPPVAVDAWSSPYPGAARPVKPKLSPDLLRLVVGALRDCARDVLAW